MTDDKLLLARGADLARAAEYRGAAFSGFLTPAEQQLLLTLRLPAGVRLAFDGGHPEAERRMAVFFSGDETPEAPIKTLKVTTRETPPGHREILGTITGNGVNRDKIGDILTAGPAPLILCEETMADWLIREITRIGRVSVQLKETLDPIPAPQVEPVRFTVASLRLDSVTAEGFRISRSKAADAIRAGLVQLNWKPVDAPDAEVRQGDRISLRGAGKIRIAEIGGRSKKDRIFVTAEKYI